MKEQRSYSWLFFIFALEGAIALAWLLSIPSEGTPISPARIALAGFLLFLCGMWVYLGFRHSRILDKFARPAYVWGTVVLSLFLGLTLFLLRYLDPGTLLPFYERLSPLLWYLLLLALQLSVFLLYLYKGIYPSALTGYKPVYVSTAVALTVLLGLFALIASTRLGLTPDPAYWGEPGAPILGWQFVAALILGAGVFCLSFYLRPSTLDVMLPVSIYFAAALIWLSVPVEVLKNSFYMRISAPDYQPYPYSDSSYYDQMAQSLLIGHPYRGEIPTRPLYIAFLAILHLVFGENYPRILNAQTLALAFLPVILYFLGRKLHSRAAGVIVALFFIFRELTSLLVSSATRVTNTKMILVDLPTLLFLLLACLFVFRWLGSRKPFDAFVAGGSLGMLLLLRTQSMVILPFILLIAWFELGWRNKAFYLQSILFGAGIAVTVAPWLIHNYLQTGRFAFDAAFQVNLFVHQYAAFGNLDVSNYIAEDRGVGYILLQFMINDPGHVFGFIANHFFAILVNSLLALPMIEPFNGLFEPINLYWMRWDGHAAWYNAALFVLYLAVVSLGLVAAWRRWRWRGLLPLAFSLGYALATAMSRFSSWRYDFPSDWSVYFYFGVGFAELLHQVAALFGVVSPPSDAKEPQPAQTRPHLKNFAVMASVFVFIGALPWALKGIASPRYPDQSPDVSLTMLSTIQNIPPPGELRSFLSQPGSFIQTGRLLYPRFFPREMGLSSTNPSPAYAIRDYARMGFYVLNQTSTAVVFPVDKVPGPVPHAADVIVMGCRRDTYVEAGLIAFPALDFYYLSPSFRYSCSD